MGFVKKIDFSIYILLYINAAKNVKNPVLHFICLQTRPYHFLSFWITS